MMHNVSLFSLLLESSWLSMVLHGAPWCATKHHEVLNTVFLMEHQYIVHDMTQ